MVFDRLIAQSPHDGLLWFAKGEVYRLRAESGDYDSALRAYEQALDANGAPAETYRSTMLMQLKQGNKAKARETLDLYLRQNPDAADAEALEMLFY